MQKICIEYFSFQGGDLLPLVLFLYNTLYVYPSPLTVSDHHLPTPVTLNTLVIGALGMTSSDHSRPGQHGHPTVVSVRTVDPAADPRLHHVGPA